MESKKAQNSLQIIDFIWKICRQIFNFEVFMYYITRMYFLMSYNISQVEFSKADIYSAHIEPFIFSSVSSQSADCHWILATSLS